MTIRELTYVALKITGILCFLWAFRMWEYAASIIALLHSPPDWSTGLNDWPIAYLIIGLIPFVFTVIIATLLFAKTDLVIKWLSLPDYKEDAGEVRVEAFMSAALGILGVVLLINAISKLIYIPGQFMALSNYSGQRASEILFRTIEMGVEILILIALGLYLFFRGDGLIGIWRRYREKTKLIDY